MLRRKVPVGWLLIGIAFGSSCAWFIGGHAGEVRERHHRCDRERELVAPVLAADPAFGRVEVVDDTAPGGGLLLLGPVKNRDDRQRLRAKVAHLFGDPRADAALMLVYEESR
jgi:hypothetical protein